MLTVIHCHWAVIAEGHNLALMQCNDIVPNCEKRNPAFGVEKAKRKQRAAGLSSK